MYHVSPLPEVVGVFDPVAMHESFDAAITRPSNPHVYDKDLVTKIIGLSHEIQIDWVEGFDIEDYMSTGRVAAFQLEQLPKPKKTLEDKWHFDVVKDAELHKIVPAPIILGTSRYPTLFLEGVVDIPNTSESRYEEQGHTFFSSEEGETLINAATEKGDARPVTFKPGENLFVPPCTIHRRNVPQSARGFRYLYKRYPRELFAK